MDSTLRVLTLGTLKSTSIPSQVSRSIIPCSVSTNYCFYMFNVNH